MNPSEPSNDQQPEINNQPQITPAAPPTVSNGFTPNVLPVQNTSLPPNKSSKKTLIIMLVVLLLGLGGVTFALLNNNDDQEEDTKTVQTDRSDDESDQQYTESQKKARDTQRITDINNLHAKLEEYYNENNGYPSTFTAAAFPGIDSEALLDPDKKPITIHKPVADPGAGQALANPSADGPSYSYVASPTNCTKFCTGYVLKTYIDLPNGRHTNPYVKLGLNNP